MKSLNVRTYRREPRPHPADAGCWTVAVLQGGTVREYRGSFPTRGAAWAAIRRGFGRVDEDPAQLVLAVFILPGCRAR